MITYTQHIQWGSNEVSVSGEALADVQSAAINLAKEAGWTPRKRWQFWRWAEPSYSHLKQYF